MADALIPYGDTRIVLRHNDSVVLYDSTLRRVVARDGQHDPDSHSATVRNCPTCGQPYGSQSFHQDEDPTARGARGDAPPDYFRMLAGNIVEPPQSPVRQLAEPRHPSTESLRSSAQPTQSRKSTPGEAAYLPPEGQTATEIDPKAFSHGYFEQFFQSSSELGRGGRGVVLLAKHVIDRVDLGWYAIKRIPVGNDHSWLMKILTEVQLLSKLHHDNLVQYKHAWLEEVQISNFGPSVPCAFVCQEYCNAGDLHRFIYGDLNKSLNTKEAMKENYRRRNSKMSDGIKEAGIGLRRLALDEIHSFFKQITAGVNYLHENNYVHRDLKPSNCLLHDTGSELRVLVSDFGEVQLGDQIREGTGATGTISYCAPEVLKLDAQTGTLGAFTTKSDVFSLGMVLHFLCFGQLPYRNADGVNEDDEDIEQLKDEISKWAGFEDERHLRTDLPDALYQNLSWLLSTNPGHRPSTADILAGLEKPDVSGRFNHSRSNSSSKSPSFTRRSSKDVSLDVRRNSRIGGVSTERNRSQGSVSGASSSALMRSSASLRRHISPSKFGDRSFTASATSNESAIAAEADSDGAEESSQITSDSYLQDGALVRSRPVSRATSPTKDDEPFSRPRTLSDQARRRQQKVEHQPLLLITGGNGRRAWIASLCHYAGTGLRSLLLSSRRIARALQLTVFVGKLLSLYVPCLPAAVNPRVALPLLLLALADFALPSPSASLSPSFPDSPAFQNGHRLARKHSSGHFFFAYFFSGLLLAIHIGLIYYFNNYNGLFVNSSSTAAMFTGSKLTLCLDQRHASSPLSSSTYYDEQPW